MVLFIVCFIAWYIDSVLVHSLDICWASARHLFDNMAYSCIISLQMLDTQIKNGYFWLPVSTVTSYSCQFLLTITFTIKLNIHENVRYNRLSDTANDCNH